MAPLRGERWIVWSKSGEFDKSSHCHKLEQPSIVTGASDQHCLLLRTLWVGLNPKVPTEGMIVKAEPCFYLILLHQRRGHPLFEAFPLHNADSFVKIYLLS